MAKLDSKTELKHPVLVEVLSRVNWEFATGLYKQCLIGREENAFLSPFSVSTALAIILLGAKGETQSQMTQALSLNELDGPTAITKAFEDANNSIGKTVPPSVNLLKVNGLYLQDKLILVPEYKNSIEKHFSTMIDHVDFVGKPADARAHINQFVEKVTNNKLRDLVGEGVINDNTRLLLINAIYFSARWDTKFDPALTTKQQFTGPKGKKEMVDMMVRRSEFLYSKSDETHCTMVKIPYIGKELAMYFLLPNEASGLPLLEANFTYDTFRKMVDKSQTVDVKVSIPRFKIASNFILNEPLSAMGMTNLFVKGRADLTGMVKSDLLYVSSVLHKTYVEVNEDGTEATAATSAQIQTLSIKPELTFLADHPFLVLIRDDVTGLILFMGRVMQPV